MIASLVIIRAYWNKLHYSSFVLVNVKRFQGYISIY